MGRKIEFTDVTLRDAHQSLFATRMKTKDMVEIAPVIDKAGFWSVEMWGGATFDVCLRFLREDPWERLKILRKLMPNSRLQMLLRGQNLVGYRHYPDDVVRAFVRKAAENGIDVFRIFDALNDLRNVEVAVETAKEMGKIVEGALSYTISPVHTEDLYIELALEFKEMGADIITIKDMAGLLSPERAYSLVKALKEEVGLPVHVHTHCTSGMAEMAQLKAIEAGADIIDVASSPMASDTSHPAVETMAYALGEFGYEIGLDKKALKKMAQHFKEVRKKYKKYDIDFKGVDAAVLEHQIPGGMISNLINQLKEQGALDKLEEVLKEVPRVREDFGYPPLVTPTSQIVGTQAVLNVLAGERYKMITQETKNYVKGLYGRPPAPIKEEIIKKVLGDEEPITCRPADLLQPELEKCREEIKDLARSEEDVLSYCLFPKVAKEFFEWREKFEKGEVPPPEVEESLEEIPQECLAPYEFQVTVHGETYNIEIAGVGEKTPSGRPYFIRIDGKLEEVMVQPIREAEVISGQFSETPEGTIAVGKRPRPKGVGDVTSPVSGKVTEIRVNVGDEVKEGDVLLIVEAMKMANEVHAPISGTVEEILVRVGEHVNPDEVLIRIKPKKK